MQLKYSRLFPGEISLLYLIVPPRGRVIELQGKYIPFCEVAPHMQRKKGLYEDMTAMCLLLEKKLSVAK